MINGRRRVGTGRRGLKLALGAGIVLAAVVLVVYTGPRTRVTGAGTDVRLYVVGKQKTVTMPLEEYVIGAVAAAMPVDAPMEALRAQAVVCRSLACYHLVPRGVPVTTATADISDDPNQGQPWMSTREMRQRWGWAFALNYLKVTDAVWSTRGEIATYGQQPIDAVFFGGSGGHGTENALDVWGVDVPYLRRVAGQKRAGRPDVATYRFSLATADKLLTTRLGPASRVRILSTTGSGRPLVVQLGTSFLTGQYLARRLQLPSSYFDLSLSGDTLTVTTVGRGNGVGMSQAGAEAMAARGAQWPAIIRHYYTGVAITRWPGA